MASIFITTPENDSQVNQTFPVEGTYDISAARAAGSLGSGVFVKCTVKHPNGETYEQGPFPPQGESDWNCTFTDLPAASGAELRAYLLDEEGGEIAPPYGPVLIQIVE